MASIHMIDASTILNDINDLASRDAHRRLAWAPSALDRERRAAWAGFQAGGNIAGLTRYAVTIAYNPPAGRPGQWVRPARIRLDVDRLHRTVDRALCGSHYHLFPMSRRTSFQGIVEHLDSNVHVHMTWSVPDDRVREFSNAITRAWLRYIRSGSIVVEPIRDDGWGWYLAKSGIRNLDDPDLFVSSRSLAGK